jgi:AraC-like DNA-binding protein
MIKVCNEEWEILAPLANYDAGKMARLCRRSPRQLQRDFKRLFNRTPQVWLNEQRLLVACERLLHGEPVKRVALDLGFKHSSNFCRQFKAFYDQTPTQFAAPLRRPSFVAVG